MRDDELQATTLGFIQCLRMLAEEASILRLEHTFVALQGALDTCHHEISANLVVDPFGLMPPSPVVH